MQSNRIFGSLDKRNMASMMKLTVSILLCCTGIMEQQ